MGHYGRNTAFPEKWISGRGLMVALFRKPHLTETMSAILLGVAIQNEQIRPYPCNCCGFLTLTDPALGSYEICPVCLWEDDAVQNEDPDFAGGANSVSLTEARENYVRFGACEPAFVDKVRAPTVDEVPAPTVIQGLEPFKQAAILRGVKATLLGIVRAMLSGRVAILEGCAAVAAVAWPLDESRLDEILRPFAAVASEMDAFPTGATRDLWSPEALAIEDAKAADYARRMGGSVKDACIRLEELLRADLL
jgi:hypothetical protein